MHAPRRTQQVILDLLTSYFQPWFKTDVNSILDEQEIDAIRKGKYVSFHVRRTDKLTYHESTRIETVVSVSVREHHQSHHRKRHTPTHAALFPTNGAHTRYRSPQIFTLLVVEIVNKYWHPLTRVTPVNMSEHVRFHTEAVHTDFRYKRNITVILASISRRFKVECVIRGKCKSMLLNHT